ncbi:MAG: hypothetical protein QXI58_06615 [Candidatus Micrarchaeia archaeon]
MKKERKEKRKEKKKEKSLKGQFFSYDAIFASVLFGIVLSLIFVYCISLKNVAFSEVNEMFSMALSFSDSLMKPGNPQNWVDVYNNDIKNLPQISSIGLTKGYTYEIDLQKFESFSNLASNDEGYNKIKENHALYFYDFYVELNYENMEMTAGKKPESPISKVFFTKPVVVNGKSGNLTITIWRK